MHPHISVGTVTANYNNGRYIKECLQGLINQTYKPEYICIVDDGSTKDDIDLIFSSIKELNGKIYQVNKKDINEIHGWHFGKINNIQLAIFIARGNKGPARARNIGVSYLLNRVDVICVADADDVYYPDKIKKSISAMQKYPHVGLVYSDYDIFNEKENKSSREYKEPFNLNKLFQECIVSNNSAILSKAIEQVGLYDESLFGPEDYDMWLRIADLYAVYHIPEALYKYRLSGQNITITTPKQQFAEHVHRVHEKARERYAKQQ